MNEKLTNRPKPLAEKFFLFVFMRVSYEYIASPTNMFMIVKGTKTFLFSHTFYTYVVHINLEILQFLCRLEYKQNSYLFPHVVPHKGRKNKLLPMKENSFMLGLNLSGLEN